MENSCIPIGMGVGMTHTVAEAAAAEAEAEDKEGSRKGPWTSEEDTLLRTYISCYGQGRWDALAKAAGLKRNGKSCRLRWVNYLRPDLKRSRITLDEELLIIDLHRRLGNRWSRIAQHLPGRTDNEIKNYFRNHIRKKIMCKPEDHVEFQSKTVQGERSVKADQQMGGKHSDPLKENQMTVINEWIGGGCEFFGNEFQNYCRSLSMDDISVSPQSSSESSEFVDYTDQLWNVFDNNALAQ